MSETNTIILILLTTAVVAFLWSTIPALWGKVFTFATGALASITAVATVVISIQSDLLTMWAVITLLLVATAFANMLRTDRKEQTL